MANMFFVAEDEDEPEAAADGILAFLEEQGDEPLTFTEVPKKERKPYKVLHNRKFIERERDLRKEKEERKKLDRLKKAEERKKLEAERKKKQEEERLRKIEEMKEKYAQLVKDFAASFKKPEKALPKLEDFQIQRPEEEEEKKEESDEKPVKFEEQVELLKTCENSQLATPANEEEAKEENYYDEEFEEDVLEYFQQHPPQDGKIKCINCHQFKKFEQILFFKRPHKHSFCKQCLRNNYYWFDNKKED